MAAGEPMILWLVPIVVLALVGLAAIADRVIGPDPWLGEVVWDPRDDRDLLP